MPDTIHAKRRHLEHALTTGNDDESVLAALILRFLDDNVGASIEQLCAEGLDYPRLTRFPRLGARDIQRNVPVPCPLCM